MKSFKYIALALFSLGLVSCGGDYLDTKNTDYLDSERAAQAAAKKPEVFLNGMWTHLVANASSTDHDRFGHMAVGFATDAMTEDIAFKGLHWFQYDYQLDYRLAHWGRTSFFWSTYYTLIAKANEVISLYPNGAQTNDEKALVGQAYAMRGMSYYYLIQLYQNVVKSDGTLNLDAKGVPLMYTSVEGKSEAEVAAARGRNTVSDVFKQIESDLTQATTLLTDSKYSRPNKNFVDAHVANGLLARYYLLSQQWQKAADAANAAREGYAMMDADGLKDGFMDISNAEWMWGFDHTAETKTTYASFFSQVSSLAPGYAGLGYSTKLIDKRLYDKISADDYRKALFTGPNGNPQQKSPGARIPYANVKFGTDGVWKQKDGKWVQEEVKWEMDYVYMRAAEMVLIEAEAYAHLGDNAKAAQTLAVLMNNRQPSWNATSVTVEEVYLQRRIELWGEGFAYYDLKRMNRGINRNYEGTNHAEGYRLEVPAQDVLWTFQIPLRELQENKLISEDDQNP